MKTVTDINCSTCVMTKQTLDVLQCQCTRERVKRDGSCGVRRVKVTLWPTAENFQVVRLCSYLTEGVFVVNVIVVMTNRWTWAVIGSLEHFRHLEKQTLLLFSYQDQDPIQSHLHIPTESSHHWHRLCAAGDKPLWGPLKKEVLLKTLFILKWGKLFKHRKHPVWFLSVYLIKEF